MYCSCVNTIAIVSWEDVITQCDNSEHRQVGNIVLSQQVGPDQYIINIISNIIKGEYCATTQV